MKSKVDHVHKYSFLLKNHVSYTMKVCRGDSEITTSHMRMFTDRVQCVENAVKGCLKALLSVQTQTLMGFVFNTIETDIASDHSQVVSSYCHSVLLMHDEQKLLSSLQLIPL